MIVRPSVRDIGDAISDRQEVEAKLSHLAAIVESSPDAILGISPDAVITSSNPAAEALLGYAPADLAGLPLHALSAGGHEPLEPVFRRVMAGERIAHHQSAWKRRDGTQVPVLISLAPLRQGGRVVGVAAIAHDVSALRLADEALQESDQKFRALMRAGAGVIFIMQGTRLIDISPAAETITGYTREELFEIGLDLVHPDDRETVRARALARQRGETVSASYEMRVLTKRGGELCMFVSAARIRYKGEPAVVGLAFDITDRKRAELAAHESETRYRLVIAALEEGVVVHDRSGAITSCNASAQRILGLSAEEIIGRVSCASGWRAVREDGSPFPGDTDPAAVTLRTGVPQRGVVRGLQRTDGSLVWISVNSHPLSRPGQDAPDGVVSSFTDISERKRTEEMLRAGEEAERRARLIAETL